MIVSLFLCEVTVDVILCRPKVRRLTYACLVFWFLQFVETAKNNSIGTLVAHLMWNILLYKFQSI
jgi:hypothetical protein